MKTDVEQMAMRFDKTAVSDQTPQKAAKLVFDAYSNILRKTDIVTNLRDMSYDDVETFWKSKDADSRCIRRRDNEMNLVQKHNLPFYAFYYDVNIKLKFLMFSYTFVSPQIQGLILNEETGSIRVMDLYSQLKRFDAYVQLDKQGEEIHLNFLAELDTQKIVFLPKFLDTQRINTVLEKLNILRLQRQIVQEVLLSQLRNCIMYFSQMGFIPPLNIEEIQLKPCGISGMRKQPNEFEKEDIWLPYWKIV